MNKKIFWFVLAIVIASVMIIPSGIVHSYQPVEAYNPTARKLSQEYLDLLPAGYVVPENLPSTITDPILLAGWVYLYNQQEPLRAWNDEVLTGRQLANSVIDRKVTIQWNTKNECNGASCTERPICNLNHTCPVDQENSSKIDIVISVHYQDRDSIDIRQLAGTLAHEMIHYLMPFGGPNDTLYEEFWAFTIGSQISENTDLDFEGYQPLTESCLKLWFQSNWKNYYSYLLSYPPSIQTSADTLRMDCTIIRLLPGETNGFPSGK